MKTLYLVKLGGSLITDKDKPFTERPDVIQQLSKEIAEAIKENGFDIAVGHGGGSFPHQPAYEYKTAHGAVNEKSYEGVSRVQDAASRLNRIVVKEMISAGINAMSIQLSSCALAKNGNLKEMYLTPLKVAVEKGIVPVIYGDVAFDIEKGCTIISTEKIISYMVQNPDLAKKHTLRVIVCGNVDGVMKNFGTDEQELVKKITPQNYDEVLAHCAGSAGIDVTGGMRHKVEQMIELAKKGIESQIINGAKPGMLKRALLGDRTLGTLISAE